MRFGDCDKLADKRRGPVPAFGVRTDAICLNAQVVGVFGATENVEIAGNNRGGEVAVYGGSVAARCTRVFGRCCGGRAVGRCGGAVGADNG